MYSPSFHQKQTPLEEHQTRLANLEIRLEQAREELKEIAERISDLSNGNGDQYGDYSEQLAYKSTLFQSRVSKQEEIHNLENVYERLKNEILKLKASDATSQQHTGPLILS